MVAWKSGLSGAGAFLSEIVGGDDLLPSVFDTGIWNNNGIWDNTDIWRNTPV